MGNCLFGIERNTESRYKALSHWSSPPSVRTTAIQHRTRTAGCVIKKRIAADARLIHRVQLPGWRICARVHRTGGADRTSNRRISEENTMKRTAGEIAEYVGGELRGDTGRVIDSIASLKNAGPSDLSYAEEKFQSEVAASGAGCILVRSGEWPRQTIIVVKNPKLSFARAAAWL